ncbi:hypothetical protein VNI00_009143 [Paramarasmius palmivorus]|uniref:Uncharacterized protein n=1 Tax=Paramarasmius palmivorus TaxID=297713 RepID=A0AAW0CR70_9AGAR
METFRALGKNELPTSALFFHEPATKNEAIKTCEEHNETLFDIGVLSQYVPTFS